MAWSNWFKKRPAHRPASPGARRHKPRLGFDTLEERTTPSVTTTLVSVAVPAVAGDAISITSSSSGASFSADGNAMVFSSDATNLVAGDTNGKTDVFLANLTTGAVTRISLAGDGAQANDSSFFPSISADGRYVAFQSFATNLTSNDGNGTADIFVKDLQTGAVTLISASTAGDAGNDFSTLPAISANGQYVVFSSFATNLTADDTDAVFDVYRKNVQTGQIDLVSKTSGGQKGNDDAVIDAAAAISADGQYIAFGTNASNLLPANGDGNTKTDIYRKDMFGGDLVLVSADAAGVIGGDDSSSPLISADGNVVVFSSAANNLVAADGNGASDIFAKNLTTQAVTRVSVAADGSELVSASSSPSMSDDGAKISFVTIDAAAVAADTNGAPDVFVRDTDLGTTTRVSTRSDGSESLAGADGGRLSPDGAKVAFFSIGANFVAGDINAVADVFVKNPADGAITLASRGGNVGGNNNSALNFDVPALGADGKSVVFISSANNLAANATATGSLDVYLRNVAEGTTTLISATEAGVQGNDESSTVSISPTGTTSLIAFSSSANNLTTGDTLGLTQLYLKNPATGAVTPISATPLGDFGDGSSFNPVISGNGQYVAFITFASNLFTDDTFFDADVVVKNLVTGEFILASTTDAGAQIGGDISGVSISDDGRYVAFAASANGLVPGDTNNRLDVFVKDLVTGTLTLVSASAAGIIGNDDSSEPVLSGDGKYVGFISAANNLVPGDTNMVADAFRSEWQADPSGALKRVSTKSDGAEIDGQSGTISISQDGRYVAFASAADDLIPDDANASADVFVKDVQTGAVYLVSQSGAGAIGNGASLSPSMSRDGRTVAYSSLANNLVANDFNAFQDVYLTTLNQAPVVALAGTSTYAEGDSLTLDAGATTDADGDTLAFSWDLNGDGVFGDATGATITLTPAQLTALGLGDGPRVSHARLVVTDAFGPVVKDFDLTVTNIAPTPTITPLMVGNAEGQSVSLTGSATDPSSADVVAGIILHWDVTRNGTAVAMGGGSAFTFNLDDDGSYLVTLTATDQDNAPATTTFSVTAANRAPTITALNAPATGAAGSPVTFTPAVTDPGPADQAAGFTFSWTVTKDGAPFTNGSGAAVSFTPDTAASYGVDVRALDKDSGESTLSSATVVVTSVTLTATITPGTVGTHEGDSASFTGNSNPAGATLHWSVTRDGAALPGADGPAFSFNLDDDGDYVVTLTATDQDNGQATTTFSFTAASQAPTITAFNAPATGAEGTLISFTPAVSDAGPADQIAGFTYSWAVTKNGAAFAGGSSAAISFTPDDNGNYEVSFIATDKDLVASTPAIATIAVGDVPPTAPLTGAATAIVNVPYQLHLGALVDPGQDAPTSVVIQWGDGASDPIPLNGFNQDYQHVFTAAGDVTIRVSVTNSDGTFEAGSKTVHVVQSVAPTIAISGPDTYPEGATYALVLGAIDNPASLPITGFHITWGDGQMTTGTGMPPATLNHIYIDGPATNVISVFLLDGQDPYDNPATQSVSVTDVAPTVALTAPATVSEGASFTLTLGAIVDPGLDTISQYVVQWGDGTLDGDVGAPPATLTHTYANGDADFMITLVLTDEDGAHVAGTRSIHVTNAAPVFDAGGNTAIPEGNTFTRSGDFTDPGADTWSATVNYGDGSGVQPLALVGQHYVLDHAYPQEGTFQITVSISDGASTTTDSFQLIVNNVVPIFSVDETDTTIAEGSTFTRSNSFSDPGADTWSATVDYGEGGSPETLPLDGKSYTLNHFYRRNGVFTVTININDGTEPGVRIFAVTVTNVAPVVSAGNDVTLGVNGVFNGAGSFVDPGANSWTATVDYGDGSGVQPLALNQKSFVLNHAYTQPGAFNVTVIVNDGTVSRSDTLVVTNPNGNSAPVVSLAAPAPINEGGTYTASGSFTDPDANNFTATVDYGLGAGPVNLPLTNKTFSLSQVYPQNGQFTVTVVISDGVTSTPTSVTLTVNNVAPVISAGTNATLIVGQTLSRSGSFTDPGTETWTATVDYGDGGGPTPLTLAADKSFALSHVYTQAGTFPVTIAIGDGTATPTATFNVQVSPLTLTLSSNTIVEQSANGATVGALSTGDATTDNAATFSLVDNAGGRFALNGRNVVVANSTLLTVGTANIRARVVSNGQTFEKDFTIQIVPSDKGDDFVGRDAITGELYVARSTGSRFVTTNYQGIFNPAKTWIDVLAADFDGDGLDDVSARDQATGEVWLARNTGSTFALNKWETWNRFVTFVDTKAFDLNNDGKLDLLTREPSTGDWWASFSQGTTGLAEKIGNWDPSKTWVDMQFGDLNKDGRIDIIGRLANTGQLFASLNLTSTTINGHAKLNNQNGPWTILSDGNIGGTTVWRDVQLADVNGDTVLDYIGRVERTGHWYVNFGINGTGTVGKPAPSQFWTAWNPNANWDKVQVGDVNGDGKADLIGHTLSAGEWWVGISPATATAQVNNVKFGNAGFFYTDMFVGDFNHDGKTDVAGLRTGSGEWSVGVSSGTDFSFSVWDAWPTNPARLAVRRGKFAS